jgi:hypothetical protein
MNSPRLCNGSICGIKPCLRPNSRKSVVPPWPSPNRKTRRRLVGPEQKLLFTWFQYSKVPPTNNHAERRLHAVVIQRRVIQGTLIIASGAVSSRPPSVRARKFTASFGISLPKTPPTPRPRFIGIRLGLSRKLSGIRAELLQLGKAE